MQPDDRNNKVSLQNDSVIDALAQETGSEPAHVRALYERELAQLEATASVRGFLSLLACRNVRKVLRASASKPN